jgi:nucleoside-triphosphatase
MRGGKIFLTGLPGSGKSTVFLGCVERLRGLGFTVGGIATPEIRSRGRRVGFSVVDLATGRTALLAGVEVSSSFRVGRYGVDVSGFESLALPALDYGRDRCDVIGVDEIGRMELFSKEFERMVDELIRGSKPMVSVLHRSYVSVYGARGTLIHVSPGNRDGLPEVVARGVDEYLKAGRVI